MATEHPHSLWPDYKRFRIVVEDENGAIHTCLILSGIPKDIWDARAQGMIEAFYASHGYSMISMERVVEVPVSLLGDAVDRVLQPGTYKAEEARLERAQIHSLKPR